MKPYQETQFWTTLSRDQRKTVDNRATDPHYREVFTRVANMLSEPPTAEFSEKALEELNRLSPTGGGPNYAPPPRPRDPDAPPRGMHDVQQAVDDLLDTEEDSPP